MANNQIDLFSIFNQVSKAVKDNKTSLNEADSYNHDHGDHMTEIFEVITQAMKEKKNADPADQLEYAAQLLRGQAKSGSGKLYAEGLGSAAKQITGKELNAGTIMSMLQTIMNAGQAAPQQQAQSEGGLLGSLMGSLSGSQQDDGLDLGDLMGALTGSAPSSSSNDQGGMDLGDLVGAGMKILNAAQGSDGNLESIAGALLSGTTMGESDYRKQSGQLVTSTVLKALTSMLKQ